MMPVKTDRYEDHTVLVRHKFVNEFPILTRFRQYPVGEDEEVSCLTFRDDNRSQNGLRGLCLKVESYLIERLLHLVPSLTPPEEDRQAYTSEHLARDTIQHCRNQGGNPDLILASPDLLNGLIVWGGVYCENVGTTAMGQAIDLFRTTARTDPHAEIDYIYDPYLLGERATGICLNADDVMLAFRRYPSWDTRDRCWVCAVGLEVKNPEHQVSLRGVEYFAPKPMDEVKA